MNTYLLNQKSCYLLNDPGIQDKSLPSLVKNLSFIEVHSNIEVSPLSNIYIYIYIYIYIVIHRQTVSFYQTRRTLEAGIETRPTLR